MSAVTLGGISFHGHAIPEKINFGGKHTTSKHTLIGGTRIVDAMGPVADDIRWSGRFRGAGALANAQAIDGMRKAGAQVPLTWFGLFYMVIVTEFTASTEKFFEVPYTVTCQVVSDPSQGVSSFVSSLDSLVSGDYTVAAAVAAGVTGTAATALSSLGAAIDTAGPLAGATTAVLLTVASAAANATVAFDDAVIANDPALDTTTFSSPDPADLVDWLLGTTTAMLQQSATIEAGAYVTRIGVNLAINQG